MPNIRLKRSLTSGSLPTTASLTEGELAMNVPDGRIFLRKSGSGTDTIESVITTGAQNSGTVQLTGSMSVSGSGDILTAQGDNIYFTGNLMEFSGDVFEMTGSVKIVGSTAMTGSLGVSGSLTVLQGITGSLFGTASNAVSASYAPSTPSFPYTGSALITGSLGVTGSISATGNIIASGETASTIASFGTSKELKSLPTATYPSLTELTYVKGVTSNIQTQLNTKATFSGTTNYLLKYGTSTTQATSRIQDTGTYIGIDTIYAPTKDLTFVGTKAIEIGLEDYSPIIEGKDLKLSAGRAVNFAYGSFSKLNFGTGGANGYGGLHISPSTNVAYIVQRYSTLLSSNYPYTTKVDTGIAMSSAWAIHMTPQNNLYMTDYGNIYKRAGNSGSFVFQASLGSNYAKGITSTSTGDLYYSIVNGDIYKQTNQTGTPVALSQTSRNWSGLATDASDNIYASVNGGDIYKRVGTGSFVAMGYTTRPYTCITITPLGDVFLGDSSGNVWKQASGAGAPTLFAAVGLSIAGITCDSYSNLYLTIDGGGTGADVYFNLNSTTGTSDLQGGTLKLAAGTGKGAGASKIHFITGQVTGSGTNMQTETVRAIIDETGVMTLPSITNALIVSESTGKVLITKEYLNSVTGSMTVLSASYATTASYAATASYVQAYEVNQIIITTTASITTDTTGSSGFGQSGRNVLLDNGANAINLTCDTGSVSNFVASYTKLGSSAITFVAGTGATLVQVDSTAILNGIVGSTACLTRNGNTYYLQISNR